MDLKAILEEWAVDCVINDSSLDKSSRETPKLHAKYLQLLAEAKLAKKRAEFQQKVLLKDKWLWYNGKLSQEEIIAKGWNPDPFDGLKVLKGEMEHYYESDPELQQSEEKITYFKTVIDTLNEIVSTLNWRHQNIKNIIEWRKFESGG